jgi:hypothetical protein
MKIANRDAREFVVKQHPFEGSNLFAEFFCPDTKDSTEGQNGYVVYSYGKHFPMYICLHLGGRDIWFANEDKYSRSTTRHQSQARPVWDGSAMHWLSTEWMLRIVRGGYRSIAQQRVVQGVTL